MEVRRQLRTGREVRGPALPCSVPVNTQSSYTLPRAWVDPSFARAVEVLEDRVSKALGGRLQVCFLGGGGVGGYWCEQLAGAECLSLSSITVGGSGSGWLLPEHWHTLPIPIFEEVLAGSAEEGVDPQDS